MICYNETKKRKNRKNFIKWRGKDLKSYLFETKPNMCLFKKAIHKCYIKEEKAILKPSFLVSGQLSIILTWIRPMSTALCSAGHPGLTDAHAGLMVWGWGRI